MTGHHCKVTDAHHDVTMRSYDADVDNAHVYWHPTYPRTRHVSFESLGRRSDERQLDWCSASDKEERPASQAHLSLSPRSGRLITPVDDDGDDEHLHPWQCIHIQKITNCVDDGLRETLLQSHRTDDTLSVYAHLWTQRSQCWQRRSSHHDVVLDADESVDGVSFGPGAAPQSWSVSLAFLACQQSTLRMLLGASYPGQLINATLHQISCMRQSMTPPQSQFLLKLILERDARSADNSF